jgi:O-antigen ligase
MRSSTIRSTTFHGAAQSAERWRPTILQRVAYVLVWLGVASSAVVFSEPAPVDLLTMGLIVGLPLVGLVSVSPALWLLAAAWGVCGAGALVASAFAPDIAKAATHTGISIYLYAAFFVFAAFVAKRPLEHTRLILDAYLWAAFVGAVAGVIGYFGLVPGAFEMFTKFGRAAGTFKDPNVFGPFLVPPILYALHKVLNRPLHRTLVPAVMMVFLSFALLLSFSRGAWFNAAVAITIYVYFSVVFAPSTRHRLKMLLLGSLALIAASGVLAMASQHEAVGDLLSHRASLTHDYDVGPQGRFGGQQKAKALIVENPLGIGAHVFARYYHHEEPHNVYLAVFLTAGWIGGFVFAAIVWLTVLWGLRHALLRTATQPLFVIAYAAFTANALEGFVIDLDHWRHFYLQMAIVWGLMLADCKVLPTAALPRYRRPQRIASARRPAHA